MLDEKYIKPIPKYMIKLIQKHDKRNMRIYNGHTRYYAYFTKMQGKLAQVTVACKNRGKKWYCKQVAAHGVNEQWCLVKDIACFIIAGYVTGWYEQGLTKYRKWWETGAWDYAKSQYFNIGLVINPEYALKFEKYKYSAIDRYFGFDKLKYLQMYEKYPQTEMLVKFGCYQYATSKQILEKIGKDKNFRNWIAKNRNELCFKGYYVSTILTAYRTVKPLKETQEYLQCKKSFNSDADYKPIRELLKEQNRSLEKFFEYIDNQNTNYRTYLDYLEACEYLHIDMAQDKNIFPHNFKHWHDIRIDEYRTAKALADKEERKDLYSKFEQIAEKYRFLEHNRKNTYICIIAKSPQDLITEGELLHHCVGRMNYDQKFIREETLIFFVRDREQPNIPLVTMEYSLETKRILQCYGDHDSKPSEEILEYVNKKWLPYAKRQTKKLIAA